MAAHQRRGPAPLLGHRPAQAAQLRHEHERLEGDRQRHLALARLAVAKADRDLRDPEPGEQRAVGQLDVEHVALRAQRGRLDRLEHAAADAAETAGEVAHPDAQDRASVERAEAAEQPRSGGQSTISPARHVARAEHQVALRSGRDERRQVLRVVREVRVHHDHQLGPAGERVREARPGTPCRAPPCPADAAPRPPAAPPRAGRRARRCRRARRRRRRAGASRPARRARADPRSRGRCASRLLGLVVGRQEEPQAGCIARARYGARRCRRHQLRHGRPGVR